MERKIPNLDISQKIYLKLKMLGPNRFRYSHISICMFRWISHLSYTKPQYKLSLATEDPTLNTQSGV